MQVKPQLVFLQKANTGNLSETERFLVILNFMGRQKILSLPEHTYGKVLFSTHRMPEEFSYFQKMQISPFEATVCLVIE